MSSYPSSRPQDRNAFEVAIICALSLEAGAMIALFDEFWEHDAQYTKAHGDTNSYTIGRIGSHHVVLVHLSHMGKGSAANVAANLRSSFPQIRLNLLVGICGGVPFTNDTNDGRHEIILGDVVISTYIVQTDFGRQYSDSLIRKNTPLDNLGRPSPEINAFLSNLQVRSVQTKLEAHTRTHLMTVLATEDFQSAYPGVHDDNLYESIYRHKHQDTQACAICAKSMYPEDSICRSALSLPCAELGCDASRLIPRCRIEDKINKGSDPHSPMVHFGAIASGDQVLKSAQHRDRIARQENVIAFEMEGAMLWESIPTIVVKGMWYDFKNAPLKVIAYHERHPEKPPLPEFFARWASSHTTPATTPAGSPGAQPTDTPVSASDDLYGTTPVASPGHLAGWPASWLAS
ncbi:purine and uridine phosphorylase [Aspergillus homomorphus CBS 101889]|uniref:Purine and uridine phosphorylase n=1 Tax=Aspergillus homomorphus (strain CBS 101889) TaxID=1450537 RepID=A0A395HIU2_ASPHC|nr:purine and uridine phosphorylase [Aspergillus homomorphus CBS 101889]RAL07841.1 purine and uridine phosphorylase [Aspergillus homomorphus CBS 101889]